MKNAILYAPIQRNERKTCRGSLKILIVLYNSFHFQLRKLFKYYCMMNDHLLNEVRNIYLKIVTLYDTIWWKRRRRNEEDLWEFWSRTFEMLIFIISVYLLVICFFRQSSFETFFRSSMINKIKNNKRLSTMKCWLR